METERKSKSKKAAHAHFAFLPSHSSFPYSYLPSGKHLSNGANGTADHHYKKLPLDLWRRILGYRIAEAKAWHVQIRLMLVCKAWHKIVWSLSKRIDFTRMPPSYLNVIVRNASHTVSIFSMDKGDDLTVPVVLSCFTTLTRLELFHCESLTDKGTRKLTALKELRYLSLGWCSSITDTTLRRVASCPNLEHFSLSRCRGITRTGLAALASLASSLSHLSLTQCDGLVDADFCFLPSLIALSSLHISACHGITGALCGLLPPSIRDIRIHECQNLESLSALVPNLPSSSTPRAQLTSSRPPQLTRLEISGCKGLTSKGVSVLANFPTLRSLNISFTFLTDEAMPTIASLSQLTSLDLTNASLTNTGLALLSSLSSLTFLDLGLTNITDEGLPPLLSSLPQLTTLVLFKCRQIDGTGFAGLCSLPPDAPPDSSTSSLPSGHTSLTKLDMGHCGLLKDNGLVPLAAAFPSLQTLLLPGCKEITARGLEHLPSAITSLNLSGCKILTHELTKTEEDESSLHFMERLTQLKELHLYKASNAHLRELAGYPCRTSLEVLHLSESKYVNDTGFGFLLSFAALRSLHIKDCHKISVPTLLSINQLSRLEIIHLPRDKARACHKKLLSTMDSLHIVGL